MTDAYLVTIMLVLLVAGGLIGSGLTVLAFRRRELLHHRERARLAGETQMEQSASPMDHLQSRFTSLEERVDFTEQLMLSRAGEGGASGPA